jgi:hypothetical protein
MPRKSIMDYFKTDIDLNTLVKSMPEERDTVLNRNEIISLMANLEDIADTGCEFTVTFNPLIHERYKSVTLTQMVFDLLHRIKLKDRENLEIILVGEFSEVGRYHMHGVIKASNSRLLKRIRQKFTLEMGRIEIKQIHNVPKYIDYIFKGIPQRYIKYNEVIRFISINYSVPKMPNGFNTQ